MGPEYIKLWLLLGGTLVFAMALTYMVLKPPSAGKQPKRISKDTAARAMYVAEATGSSPTQHIE